MVSSSVPYCGANSCVSTDRLAHERGWTPKLADSDPTHENSHPDCSTDSTILNDWPSFLNVLSMLVSEPRQVHDGSVEAGAIGAVLSVLSGGRSQPLRSAGFLARCRAFAFAIGPWPRSGGR